MLFMGPPKHDASFTTWKHGKQQHVTWIYLNCAVTKTYVIQKNLSHVYLGVSCKKYQILLPLFCHRLPILFKHLPCPFDCKHWKIKTLNTMEVALTCIVMFFIENVCQLIAPVPTDWFKLMNLRSWTLDIFSKSPQKDPNVQKFLGVPQNINNINCQKNLPLGMKSNLQNWCQSGSARKCSTLKTVLSPCVA